MISSSCLDTRVIFSNDVNSGRSSVGQKQIARFLLSMLFSVECSATLQEENTNIRDFLMQGLLQWSLEKLINSFLVCAQNASLCFERVILFGFI